MTPTQQLIDVAKMANLSQIELDLQAAGSWNFANMIRNIKDALAACEKEQSEQASKAETPVPHQPDCRCIVCCDMTAREASKAGEIPPSLSPTQRTEVERIARKAALKAIKDVLLRLPDEQNENDQYDDVLESADQVCDALLSSLDSKGQRQ
jgi:hypothetical protein